MKDPIFRGAWLVVAALASACALGCSTQVDLSGMHAGAGGSGEGGSGEGGSPVCVPQPADPDAGFEQPTCVDLGGMIVRDPVITDDGADGTVSPGESLTLTVKLKEIAGKGFGMYPGVTFTTDVGTIDDPGGAQFYAILACQIDDAQVRITAPSNVAKGTVMHVKAQVSMLNATCPDADAIMVPITLQ